VPAFLRSAEVRLLAGAGFEEDLMERLELLGFGQLLAVQRLTKRHLEAQFGPEGERLYALLHPRDEQPVTAFQPAPAVTAFLHLDVPCREPGELMPALEHLVEESAAALRSLYARRLTVRVYERGQEKPRYVSRILPEATSMKGRLLSTARVLLMHLLSEEMEIEGISVELGALQRGQIEQRGLFTERPSVYLAVRGVHRRFPGAIKRALVCVHALFQEEQVRYEPFPEAEPVRRRA
jgi:nucleotidyltransferase/DNA polymerase involved in DNA repair